MISSVFGISFMMFLKLFISTRLIRFDFVFSKFGVCIPPLLCISNFIGIMLCLYRFYFLIVKICQDFLTFPAFSSQFSDSICRRIYSSCVKIVFYILKFVFVPIFSLSFASLYQHNEAVLIHPIFLRWLWTSSCFLLQSAVWMICGPLIEMIDCINGVLLILRSRRILIVRDWNCWLGMTQQIPNGKS